MKNQLLHTPDGVRDIYNGECAKKLVLQERLSTVLKEYGYQNIQTPSFEFFDIFGKEIGTTPSKDLYKFFDKEGNTLVLRPDFTPAIARCAVKYYLEEQMPVKLCYMGNTFTNSSDYQGRLKESTQCGAESIGDSSVYSDAELLAMTVDSLKAAGLKDFQISVGHSQFFSGLIEAANVDEETENELKNLLNNKNFFGVEEALENGNLNENLVYLFSLLGCFDVKEDTLKEAQKYAADYPKILKALKDLEKLNTCLKMYQIDPYISFELGIISEHNYYTGIIFAGYTFGTGEAIVKGGRYDKLLSKFGKDCPAIGFAIGVDQLLLAIERQKIDVKVEEKTVYLVYSDSKFEEAVQRAGVLRKKGCYVNMMLWNKEISKEQYQSFANKNHVNNIEFMEM